jgi:hypothetical protein
MRARDWVRAVVMSVQPSHRSAKSYQVRVSENNADCDRLLPKCAITLPVILRAASSSLFLALHFPQILSIRKHRYSYDLALSTKDQDYINGKLFVVVLSYINENPFSLSS